MKKIVLLLEMDALKFSQLFFARSRNELFTKFVLSNTQREWKWGELRWNSKASSTCARTIEAHS